MIIACRELHTYMEVDSVFITKDLWMMTTIEDKLELLMYIIQEQIDSYFRIPISQLIQYIVFGSIISRENLW